jgi:hypothetical protein
MLSRGGTFVFPLVPLRVLGDWFENGIAFVFFSSVKEEEGIE